MNPKDLLNLNLQEFRKHILENDCDYETVRAVLTDKMDIILDEKTVIENQLNAAKARYKLGTGVPDPEWFSKATGALNHRKRKIDRLNKMLSLLNKVRRQRANKLIEEGIGEIPVLNGQNYDDDTTALFFDKVFCDICRAELDEETFSKIKEKAKTVTAILRLKNLDEFSDFQSWRQKYINEHGSVFDYEQMAYIFAKANSKTE